MKFPPNIQYSIVSANRGTEHPVRTTMLMLYATCAKGFANSRPLFDLKCYADLKRTLELAGAEHCVAPLDKLYEYAWQLAAQLLSYPFLWDSFMRDMNCGMEEWSCTGIGVLPTLRPNPRWHFFPC